MSKLEFRLLGIPLVQLDGQALKFPSRKTLALVLYLLMEKGPHYREKLIALFWPESDSSSARANLRRTLAYARETLGEELSETILTGRDQLEFNRGVDFYLDLDEFEKLLLKHITTLAAGLPAPLSFQARKDNSQELGQAIKLYRGEFLEGFSLEDAPEFEAWLTRQREKWHALLEDSLERYSGWLMEQGANQQALEVARTWLYHAPLSESACERVMQLFLLLNEPASAAQVYRNYQQHLWEELKLSPSPQLAALAGKKPVSGPKEKIYPASSPGSIRPTPAQLEVKMVGRSLEFNRLSRVFQQVTRGQLGVALLLGEAGIGKTRLATEFVSWCGSQGAELVTGQTFEVSSYLPYQPLVEAFRNRLEQENALDDLLSDVWLAELSRLLPELRERLPDLPLPAVASEEEAKIRLFEAFAILGQALSRKSPLLLFIDDWQWADQASLDLLQYLVRRWHNRQLPVMVLLNLRAESLATSRQLSNWLATLERNLSVNRLELGQLSQAETAQLVIGLAGSESEQTPDQEAFVSWLLKETTGRPFYIVETIKTLLEEGLLAFLPASEGRWRLDYRAALERQAELQGFLPRGVREIIRVRLARLSQAAGALLGAGAVLGRGFSFSQLCDLSGLEESEGLEGLEELLAGGLLVEESREWEESRYFFAHDKIRDVAYTEAGDNRRRHFHRKALTLLEGQKTSPAELAYHAYAAHLALPAFHYSLLAGNEAMKLFAVKDARNHYQRAYRLIPQLEGSQQLAATELYQLLEQLGRTYELTNEVAQAREVYQRLLERAEVNNNSSVMCIALNQMVSLVSYSLQEVEEVPALLARAIAEAEKGGDKAGLALSRSNMARYYLLKDVEIARKNAWEAFQLAQEAGLAEREAFSLNILSYTEVELNLCNEAEAHAEAARQSYLARGNRAMVADCLSIISNARLRRGQVVGAIEAARTAYALYTEIENSWGQAGASYFLAMALLEHGQYREALATSEQGLAIARAININFLLIFNMAALGLALYSLGEIEKGRRAHLEALELSEQLPAKPFIKLIWSGLAIGYVLEGAWEEAAEYARKIFLSGNQGFIPYLLPYSALVKALIKQGEVSLAREEVQKLAGKINANPRLQIAHLRANGWLAYFDYGETAVEAYFAEASALARSLELPYLLEQIELDRVQF
ncbi:MAG TPA: AAA family ATPase [Chloroflexia bacterium]|nr:AAA family ATPase [Chloroflexia bacterium]